MSTAVLSYDSLDLNKLYTYADYLLWKFPERTELLNGKVYLMPRTTTKHQSILRNIWGYFFDYFGNNHTHFCVRLDFRLSPEGKYSDDEVTTVVQPDGQVICDKSKIDERGVVGAPDLVLEVMLAEDTAAYQVEKCLIYELNGVREYWEINPYKEEIKQYVFDNDRYSHPLKEIYDKDYDWRVKSAIFKRLELPI